jgi:hypothetical protein
MSSWSAARGLDTNIWGRKSLVKSWMQSWKFRGQGQGYLSSIVVYWNHAGRLEILMQCNHLSSSHSCTGPSLVRACVGPHGHIWYLCCRWASCPLMPPQHQKRPVKLLDDYQSAIHEQWCLWEAGKMIRIVQGNPLWLDRMHCILAICPIGKYSLATLRLHNTGWLQDWEGRLP